MPLEVIVNYDKIASSIDSESDSSGTSEYDSEQDEGQLFWSPLLRDREIYGANG